MSPLVHSWSAGKVVWHFYLPSSEHYNWQPATCLDLTTAARSTIRGEIHTWQQLHDPQSEVKYSSQGYVFVWPDPTGWLSLVPTAVECTHDLHNFTISMHIEHTLNVGAHLGSPIIQCTLIYSEKRCINFVHAAYPLSSSYLSPVPGELTQQHLHVRWTTTVILLAIASISTLLTLQIHSQKWSLAERKAIYNPWENH